LVNASGQSSEQMTEVLYQANNIGLVWFVMAMVGVCSAVGLVIYARWIVSVRSSLNQQQKACID